MREVDLLEWYDSLASAYDELYGEEQRAKYVEVLNKLGFDVLNASVRVLDSGCGTGKLLHELVSRGLRGHYIGIDLSLNLLLQGMKHLMNLGSNYLVVDFVAGDLMRPPFREGAFNTVFSFTVIRDRVSDIRIINNLRSLTEDRGILAYTVLSSSEGGEGVGSVCRGVYGRLTRLEGYCVEVVGDEA